MLLRVGRQAVYMISQHNSITKNELASPVESNKRFEPLMAELLEIRRSMVSQEAELEEQITSAHSLYRRSVANLIHYLALRHRDIRKLQDELAALGLSSLGRAEAHTMWTLDAVLSVLRHLAGRQHEVQFASDVISFAEGSSMLAIHSEALLGPAPAHRTVRIMVTISSEAADDYTLVRELLSHGMNIMRINCAHDTPEIWSRMAAHLKRARRELGLPCRLFMDLSGPKLRTGDIETGPQVAEWHPKRDSLGRVMAPARIWLFPAGNKSFIPEDADATLPVAADWLGAIKLGECIRFTDARGKERLLEIVTTMGNARLARCSQTAYVTPETTLVRMADANDPECEAQIVELPSRGNRIVIHKGDFLVLTRDPSPGKPVEIDSGGRVLRAATISCTLPEVFSQVRKGDRIWFDDGKIGGIVRNTQCDALRIEITQAGPKGTRLLADKGINLPDTDVRLGALTPKDLEDLTFVVRHADSVAMSFVRHEQDVHELQRHLRELNGDRLGVVLKIETRQAFERLPNLIMAAMRHYPVGIMIARGDLAVECGYERLAEVQEEMLWICEAAHLPVIWATEVLQSLAKKGQPSRAEITDAAMGERAECVMLNKGSHIVAAVTALDNILRRMQDHQSKKSSRLRRLHLSVKREAKEA
jgi:pyruvate kinase